MHSGVSNISAFSIKLKKGTLSDLACLYRLYFEVFSERITNDESSGMSPMQLRCINYYKSIFIHGVHILLERFHLAIKKGSLRPIFQKRYDMIPYLILCECEVVGFLFMKIHNPGCYEIGLIGVSDSQRGKGIGRRAVEEMESNLAQKGRVRMIARASGQRSANVFFNKLGFDVSYEEDMLYYSGDCDSKQAICDENDGEELL